MQRTRFFAFATLRLRMTARQFRVERTIVVPVLPCSGCRLWQGDHLAFAWLAPGCPFPGLGLREGSEAQAASGTLPGAGDGSDPGRAGSAKEGDGRRFVVPDLGPAAGITDDDGRGRRFLQGETEVVAGDGFGRAVAAEVG